MSFLTAEWRKLVLVNYRVDPERLSLYLPKGTQPDLWNNNTCYLSLVGFMFINTKLLGFKVPFHANFEEVNLRFYVNHFQNGVIRRGVVFIKEIVPRHAITFIANNIYKENYQTHPMKHSWLSAPGQLSVNYSWKVKSQWQHLSVKADRDTALIQPGSEEEFITEHYHGYTRVSENRTFEYEVRHPKWQLYPVTDFEISVDFGLTYGSPFLFLNNSDPASVMLAEGSPISVERKKAIVFSD